MLGTRATVELAHREGIKSSLPAAVGARPTGTTCAPHPQRIVVTCPMRYWLATGGSLVLYDSTCHPSSSSELGRDGRYTAKIFFSAARGTNAKGGRL